MRKNFIRQTLLATAVLFCGNLSAKSIVITLNTGTMVYYKISNDNPPQLVIADDGTFKLNSQDYTFSDVKNFYLSETDYSGEKNTMDGIVNINEKQDLLMNGEVRIYTLDGKLATQGNNLSSLQRGTYIITNGTTTLKIQKR